MRTVNIIKAGIAAISLTLVLAGCGGGGGGGAAEPIQSFRVTVTAGDTTLATNEGDINYEPGTEFATQIDVRITRPDGSPVPDGQTVTLSVTDSAVGALSTQGDLATQSAQLSLATSCGSASAVFHTKDQPGTTQVSASSFDGSANRNVSSSVTIVVEQGPDAGQRLTFIAERTTLPANSFSVPRFVGSPFSTEVIIEYRDADGNLAEPEDGEVSVSISPLDRAFFSILDDVDTADVDESLFNLAAGPVDTEGGRARIFVHSGAEPGLATITVNAVTQDTGEFVDDVLEIQIIEPASNGLPASISTVGGSNFLHIQGSGGRTATTLDVQVVDPAGVLVEDPVNVNNVLFEILDAPDGAVTLSGAGVNGGQQSGDFVNVGTTNGIASVALTSGNETGQVLVQATADAADNDVTDGITAPVTTEFSIDISDGVPFAVRITTFAIRSLTVNPVADTIGIENADPDDPFPLTPDATYSLRVNALVTDRAGNPPSQAVSLRAGLVDAPLDGFPLSGGGFFDLSGGDGNPAEGGRNFTAPGGEFLTAGGGAGPGDTLILFAEEIEGNKDLEGARTVEVVNSQTSLRVDEQFNDNDVTGVSEDYLAVIPYVIGRAENGNIETGLTTDSNGVATTLLNYPVSQLGRSAAVYVQGVKSDENSPGEVETFADAALIRYPGLAPLTLVASPDSIPANTTSSVTICVNDFASNPIAGSFVSFAFTGDAGVASVDGQFGSGVVAQATGFNGCTVASVTTSGILTGSDDAAVVFSVGDASDSVDIVAPQTALLQAEPSAFFGDQNNALITLTYLSGSGQPVANIALVGMCESSDGSISINQQPDPTDVNGQSFVRVTSRLDVAECPDAMGTLPESAGSGTCTFTTASGDPETTVEFTGRVIDLSLFSPNPCAP